MHEFFISCFDWVMKREVRGNFSFRFHVIASFLLGFFIEDSLVFFSFFLVLVLYAFCRRSLRISTFYCLCTVGFSSSRVISRMLNMMPKEREPSYKAKPEITTHSEVIFCCLYNHSPKGAINLLSILFLCR